MSEQDASDAGDDAVQTESAPDDANEADGGDAVDRDGANASDGAGDQERESAARGEDVDERLVERVDSADPESIAREIAGLRVEIDGLEAELAEREETVEELEETVDDLESKLARARADFKNYKKRTEERREEERQRATADLVERLLDVHDNLERALEQDEDVDIRGGVESTLQQFDDVLAAENVTPIEPAAGEEVDPHRHEVLVRVESDQPEGTIDEVHRVGYEMAGTIVREAQVTVSDGSGSADAAEGESEEDKSSEDESSEGEGETADE